MSRTYAGYATTELNAEAVANQGGFTITWMGENRINGAPVGPSLA